MHSYDENGEPSGEFFAHSVYGPVMRKEGVCEAYARVYQMLCTYYGLECIYITGYAPNHAGEDVDEEKDNAHAWNLIKLDDGKYYWVDATWDDDDPKEGGWSDKFDHAYFAVGSEPFTASHKHSPTVVEDILEAIEPSCELPWPEVSETSYRANHPEKFPTDVPADALVYTELPDGTLEVSEYKSKEYYENLIIPDEVDGKKVTALAPGLFKDSTL
ncbi:Transglutaminase-like superfamily protein, partial [Ruminococcaceae bacterium FB2012]